MKIVYIVLMALIVSACFSGAEEFRYDPHGKRDPMVPLLGQDKPGGLVSFADIASVDDVKLEGIAGVASGNRMAIINGELIKKGFRSGEVEVVDIAKNHVVLKISGQEHTINLPEEGGQKSE